MEKINAQANVEAGLEMASIFAEPLKAPKFRYQVECRGADGELKWTEDVTNVVTDEGANDLLDKYFKGSAYTAAWFMGLAGTGAKAAANALASHAAWAEVNPYTGNRPAITFGTTAARANAATAVSYACTGSATVAGAFVASVNTGTAGKLYSVSDFGTPRSVISGDTLNVTLTVSA
jgi:hypothetical protein